MNNSALLVGVLTVLATLGEVRAQGASSGLEMERTGGPAGVRHYFSNTWGLVGIDLANYGDQDAEALVTLYPEGYPTRQFARRVWVPAHAKHYTWAPVKMPELPLNIEHLGMRGLLYDLREDPPRLIDTKMGERLHESGLLQVRRRQHVSGMIAPLQRAPNPEAVRRWREIEEFVVSARVSAGMSVIAQSIFDRAVPPQAEFLEGLDHLFIANNRLAEDPAGLRAVRRWTLSGGNLWILLDQVDESLVAQLLGNAYRSQVVDRVELTEVNFQLPDGTTAHNFTPAREFEEPVEMVRVIVDGAETQLTVNGWPAAFRQPLGRGKVQFTTLGSRAWVRPRRPEDPWIRDDKMRSRLLALPELNLLASAFLKSPAPPPLEPQALQPYLAEQIGYRIVSRPVVTSILAAFCGGLLVAGVWLARRNHLERVGWIAPLLALITALPLAALGMRSKRAVPDTVGLAQFVETLPESDQAEVTGLLALYSQSQRKPQLGSDRGGVFVPESEGDEAAVWSMTWNDLDSWRWERLVVQPGVRTAEFSTSTTFRSPPSARATLGPEGLEVELVAGELEGVSDAVVAHRVQPGLALRMDPDGRLRGGRADVLAPGQYVAGTLLSDEQRRRQGVYHSLLNRQDGYPPQPTLLVWAAPLDLGFQLPEADRRVGAALVAVPLQMQRPAAGTQVAIPATFLPFRTTAGPDGKGAAASYDNQRGQWVELTRPSRTWLEFQIPEVLLPFRLNRATLTVNLNAPSRQLDLLAVAEDQVTTLERVTNPTGTQRFTIDRPETLQLDAQGRLRLGLMIGESLSEGRNLKWRIESLQLDVDGVTLESSTGAVDE